MKLFQEIGVRAPGLLFSAFLMLGIAGCEGDTGPAGPAGADGQDAVDTGSISVMVTSGGSPVEGATITTTPATSSADTDATGAATLTDVPIGVYDLTAAITGTGVEATALAVGVVAGATADVSMTLAGVPGTVSGKVVTPDGLDADDEPDPVEGAIVSTPGSAPATTDANGDFVLDSVVRGFLSVEPPAGTTLLAGGTRHSVTPGDTVEITLSGGPESDATFVSSDTCLVCHGSIQPGLVADWQNSGHYRVVERSLVEMDTTGWPADPGANLCTVWTDTEVDANAPSEDPASTPSHDVFVRTCNDDPDLRFEVLVDGNDDGADAGDTIVPVYSTYGGPGTSAGELEAVKDRGEALDLHGTWKQRYMFSIADLGACSPLNPEGTHPKNPKPAFVNWDTTQTCEDMLLTPIQYNQRTNAWVSYHNNN